MKKRDNPAENPDFKNPNSVELSLFCVSGAENRNNGGKRFCRISALCGTWFRCLL